MAADALQGVIRALKRDEWRDAFETVLRQHAGAACARAGIGLDDVARLLGAAAFTNLWGSAVEDFLTRDVGDGGVPRNILDDHLKRRGWKASVADRRYMVGLRRATMSLYEVSDIVPEQSFLARDLLRGGEPVRVAERTATRTLAPWSRIGARLVQANGRIVLAGGVLVFDFDTAARLQAALLEAHGDGEGIADAALAASAPRFTEAWLDDAFARVLDPSPPTLLNTEGDEILFHTAAYPLLPGATAAAIRERLQTLPTLRHAATGVWNWIETAPSPRQRPTPARRGHTWSTTLDDGAAVLGDVELKRRAVRLMVNSPARLARGQAMLEPLLAGLAGPASVDVATVEAAAAASRKKCSAQVEMSPGEVRELLDEHYRTTLDQPLPMLEGRTPRAVAGMPDGRAAVVRWLKYLEHGTTRHGDCALADYDFGWMWTELGVADLRR